jgi:hypothetical protein
MNLLKAAGLLALKESTDVLTRIGNHGEILVPDAFIINNPLVENNLDTAYDVYVIHPSNNGLSSKTRQKSSIYNQSNQISNGTTIFKPIWRTWS